MSVCTIRVAPQFEPTTWWTYALVDGLVRLDAPTPLLTTLATAPPFTASITSLPALLPVRRAPAHTREARLIWAGERSRRVRRWSEGATTWLAIDRLGRLAVQEDAISVVRRARAATPEQITLGWLGPAFLLTLAGRRVWGWHAGAARWGDQLAVFLGLSGQGKSTLVRYLAEAGWQPVADDLLAVSLQAGQLTAWPRYPQLKWPLEAQPTANWPEQLQVGMVVVLGENSAEISFSPLSPRNAFVQLARHTLAARLFSPAELSAHGDFCAQVAQATPVCAWNYPRRRDALPRLEQLLRAQLLAQTG